MKEEIKDQYKAVVGLEIHAQLLTQSKAFSSDHYEYGGSPNTQVSPITLGHPGTLPKPNLGALKYAVKMGLATHSKMHLETHFARKNYFYPDLPKGYQITQYTTPLCTDGYVIIKTANGNEKKIGLEKIILEEDSGKSIHDIDPFFTLVDLNRAGVPLIETVSKPHINTPEEAYNYITEIRKMVRYLGICDGNMEEGSLRCDVNVSVMKNDARQFGTKVEVKNINSINNVKRAIAYEIERQIKVKEAGGEIFHETRGFDPVANKTFEMRSKEEAQDYRYFPEPDLPPFVLTDHFIEEVSKEMPELPYEREKRYIQEFQLSEYDASLIANEREFADYFEAILKETKNYKAVANWLNGPIRSYLNENALHLDQFKLSPRHIASFADLVERGKVSFSIASQKVFPALIENPEKDPEALAKELNLIQVGDDDFLLELIDSAIGKYPEKVEEYQSGKKGLLGLFMGEVMKMSKGKADPKKTNQLLRAKLEK